MTDDLRARLEELPTGELLAALRDRDLEEWRPEAFPLIEAILAETEAICRNRPGFASRADWRRTQLERMGV